MDLDLLENEKEQLDELIKSGQYIKTCDGRLICVDEKIVGRFLDYYAKECADILTRFTFTKETGEIDQEVDDLDISSIIVNLYRNNVEFSLKVIKEIEKLSEEYDR